MNHTSFDSLARQTASAVSRRRSLMTLAGAGLAALAGPLAAEAKNKSGKNKKKNKKSPKPTAQDFCGPQVAECTAVLTNLIGDNPDSPASIACCSALATCDFTQFFACLLIESET